MGPIDVASCRDKLKPNRGIINEINSELKNVKLQLLEQSKAIEQLGDKVHPIAFMFRSHILLFTLSRFCSQ